MIKCGSKGICILGPHSSLIYAQFLVHSSPSTNSMFILKSNGNLKFLLHLQCFFTTENEYMNEEFTAGKLVHGTRYIVCVHADRKLILHESWTEELVVVSICSDGVVIDLTSPMAGAVWISHSPTVRYQGFITRSIYGYLVTGTVTSIKQPPVLRGHLFLSRYRKFHMN